MISIQELRSLPVAERIQLVEDLWDSIVEDSEGSEPTHTQRQELDRRLDDFEINPTAGAPWDQLRNTIQHML
jgi:putative addiction module component (TIGR02574 family)